ncbi:hypothetical protein AYI70_g12157 [Smittium culicis]|uniref:Uncharacterized protein n=1 Tax=Smittium culicis TaxID=133412 RepID=A0A1R1WYQ0_9FUNG|nr:hypothetical protein AYI70_g12157 [Smittium culicis]
MNLRYSLRSASMASSASEGEHESSAKIPSSPSARKTPIRAARSSVKKVLTSKQQKTPNKAIEVKIENSEADTNKDSAADKLGPSSSTPAKKSASKPKPTENIETPNSVKRRGRPPKILLEKIETPKLSLEDHTLNITPPNTVLSTKQVLSTIKDTPTVKRARSSKSSDSLPPTPTTASRKSKRSAPIEEPVPENLAEISIASNISTPLENSPKSSSSKKSKKKAAKSAEKVNMSIEKSNNNSNLNPDIPPPKPQTSSHSTPKSGPRSAKDSKPQASGSFRELKPPVFDLGSPKDSKATPLAEKSPKISTFSSTSSNNTSKLVSPKSESVTPSSTPASNNKKKSKNGNSINQQFTPTASHDPSVNKNKNTNSPSATINEPTNSESKHTPKSDAKHTPKSHDKHTPKSDAIKHNITHIEPSPSIMPVGAQSNENKKRKNKNISKISESANLPVLTQVNSNNTTDNNVDDDAPEVMSAKPNSKKSGNLSNVAAQEALLLIKNAQKAEKAKKLKIAKRKYKLEKQKKGLVDASKLVDNVVLPSYLESKITGSAGLRETSAMYVGDSVDNDVINQKVDRLLQNISNPNKKKKSKKQKLVKDDEGSIVVEPLPMNILASVNLESEDKPEPVVVKKTLKRKRRKANRMNVASANDEKVVAGFTVVNLSETSSGANNEIAGNHILRPFSGDSQTTKSLKDSLLSTKRIKRKKVFSPFANK